MLGKEGYKFKDGMQFTYSAKGVEPLIKYHIETTKLMID